MTVSLYCEPGRLYEQVHDLVRIFFPGAGVVRCSGGQESAVDIVLCQQWRGSSLHLEGRVEDGAAARGSSRMHDVPPGPHAAGEVLRLTRMFLFELLSACFPQQVHPYGILTGMRPTKLVHRWLDEGMGAAEASGRLQREHAVHRKQAHFLVQVALAEREVLAQTSSRDVSVYIGIPFCPSRCSYCSFPAAVVRDYQEQVLPFLDGLLWEMEQVGRALQEQGRRVHCLYVGGGTPTILRPADLERMASLLRRYFLPTVTGEFTVEAGRPDTLDAAKVEMLAEMGVSRVSVNPQTMHQQTLDAIGRGHTVAQVLEAVRMARAAGIPVLNMDLIVGLPGESPQHCERSLQQVLEAGPENVTIHALARKRGSPMAERHTGCWPPADSLQATETAERLHGMLAEAGYAPYYTYRQKQAVGGLENTGYARPGFACVYNVLMIEERQSMVGMGGAAACKFVDPVTLTLTRMFNPKHPPAYLAALPRLVGAKVDKLRALI